MNTIKRYILTIIVLLFTQTIFAYDFYAVNNGDTIYYNITSNTDPYTVEVAQSAYYSGDISLPSTVTYNSIIYSVTAIGNSAFYNCFDLTFVNITNSIISIGQGAFFNCGLSVIYIPSTVIHIGDFVFLGCDSLQSITVDTNNMHYKSLDGVLYNYEMDTLIECGGGKTGTITIYNAVKVIKKSAFWGCGELNGNLIIPEGVLTIGDAAFCHCIGLTSVTIGNSTTFIGNDAFAYCLGLNSVFIGNSVTYIGTHAFLYDTNLYTLYFHSINCLSVGSVYAPAFENCNKLTNINFGDSVKTIPDYIFYNVYSLTGTFVIPNSITKIGRYAFAKCSGISAVTFCNSVYSIGPFSFMGCESLKNVYFADSVKTIGDYAFYTCKKLNEIIMGVYLQYIGNYAFANTSLSSVNIPASVIKIGKFAFADCPNLISITVDEANTSYNFLDGILYTYAFDTLMQCGSGKVGGFSIPDQVKYIEDGAFYNCTQKTGNLVFPENIIKIGDYAFYNCTGLTFILIPGKVLYIGQYAFYQCVNIQELMLRPTHPPVMGDYAFQHVTKTIPVYVSCGSKSVYQQADGWNDFLKIVDTLWYTLALQINDTTMGSAVQSTEFCLTTLTATPYDNYRFVQWHDGDTSNPRTLYVTQDTVFTAEFAVKNSIQNRINETLNIYPNPVQDILCIDNHEQIINKVDIYDINGKRIKCFPVNDKKTVLSVSDLCKGIYFLNINTLQGNSRKKIVKE